MHLALIGGGVLSLVVGGGVGLLLALNQKPAAEVAEVDVPEKPAIPAAPVVKTKTKTQQKPTTESNPAQPAPIQPVVPPKAPVVVKPMPVPVPEQSTPAEPSSRFDPPPVVADPVVTTPVAPPTRPTEPQPAPTEVAVNPPMPPPVRITPRPMQPMVPQPEGPSFEPAGIKLEAELVQALLTLNDDRKLLSKKEYPAVRKLFADRFEKLYGSQLRQGLGADADEMMEWFAQHAEVREEFFNALDPSTDQLPVAASIFNELRKKFPNKIVPYYNLAIATAVVWDGDRRGVYDYTGHARRCKSVVPADMLAAVENFEYLVSAEAQMQGRIQYVPWEFLIYVVNHRTPLQERGWAMQNYAAKRQMYGKCYAEVPYDHMMLETQSAQAKLNGKDYTLPNLQTFGGVCAMQADYAARVGKSIGISSEYVRGEAAGGELHAWVMWVELKQATPTGLSFSLESFGRYQGDKFYVGELNDPKSGAQMTDRDLELRLQTVGLDTISKRHAELVMQAYESIAQQGELNTAKRLNLLHQVIQYNPGCEGAWLAVARLARESNGEKQYSKQFQAVLNQLFITFSGIPDFTWKVFADIAAYYPEGKPRAAMYEKLIQMYETAGRPDLACEARLAWAEMIGPQARQIDAMKGLADTVKKFPGEGRYVPKLLDKLEQLCGEVKDAEKHLIQFYVEVLPLVPQKRGNSPSPFAIKMFERASEVFTRYNQPQLAAAAQAELGKVRTGMGAGPPQRNN
jgi:hypothetical protein